MNKTLEFPDDTPVVAVDLQVNNYQWGVLRQNKKAVMHVQILSRTPIHKQLRVTVHRDQWTFFHHLLRKHFDVVKFMTTADANVLTDNALLA